MNRFLTKILNTFYFYDDITILCTKQTLYVAHLIELQLNRENIYTSIKLKYNSIYDNGQLYIVICPQVFAELPKKFIAFQLEQSINSRWFTNRYFEILHQALLIFDYSLINIKYLKDNGICADKLFYFPIASFANYTNYLKNKGYKLTKLNDKKIDILFYGDDNCPRRQVFFEEIKKYYLITIASGIYKEDIVNLIKSAKVVINIHYYEGALLETTRIYESLSLGVPLISEESIDMSEYSELKEIVDFFPIGNVEIMLEKIANTLNNKNYQKKLVKINKFIENDKVFSKNFTEFLTNNVLPIKNKSLVF